MGLKLLPTIDTMGPDYMFWCPGCKCYHGVWTTTRNDNHAIWGFNGDVNKPTFTPSILIQGHLGGDNYGVCHSFVKDGKIQYLNDCTHELAGQTVEMEDVDEANEITDD